jgi:hypothetical protein
VGRDKHDLHTGIPLASPDLTTSTKTKSIWSPILVNFSGYLDGHSHFGVCVP